MIAPQAHADWVLVKLEGKFVETSQNKQDGGTLSGTPQTYNKGTTSGWGGAMQLDGYTSAQLPAPPQNTYGGQTTPYTGGTAIASVDGSNFKATLEWQGGGTPTDDCSLIIASSGEVYARGSAGAEPTGPLSVDGGAKTGNGYYPAKDNQTLTTDPAPTGNDRQAYYDWMNKYPNGVSEKRLRAAGETRIPVSTRSKVLNAAGRWVVEKSISMVLKGSASVTTKGFDSTAHATTRLSFKVDPSSQGLFISSGLEPSYKKGTNGQPEQVKRSDDGSLTVESAAQWTTNSDPAVNFQGWLGGTRFTANVTGFTPPVYIWTEPANSHNQNTGQTPAVDDLSPAAPTFGTPYYGISLGSKRNGSDLTKSSTIKVDAGDLSNSYTVNWHLPYEIGAFVGVKSSTPTVTGPIPIKTSAETTSTFLESGFGGTFTQDLAQISVKAGAETAERFLSIASSIAGEVPVIGLPFEILLNQGGITLGKVPDPLPEQVDNSGGEWKNAVDTQYSINEDLKGPNVMGPQTQRLYPASLAENPNSKLDTTNELNPWRRCVMELYIRIDTDVNVYKMDTYGPNGYTGTIDGEVPKLVRHKIFVFKIQGDQ